MVAEDYDTGSIIIQCLKVLRDGSHGNQSRPLDLANGVLFWFPYIDQAKWYAGFLKGTHFRRGYLNWQYIHRPRV